MLRPIAAGLMCLGFVTLGVAATWGQDEAAKPKSADVNVFEKDAGETAPAAVAVPVKEGDLKRIEIRIGDDDGAAVVGEGEQKRVEVREGGEVIIFDAKDGKKIVQRVEANPQDGPISARVRLTGPPVVDPATREAVEKLVASLRDEVKKLEGEGKKEDAERKQQSIRVLEQVLNPGPRWAAVAGQPAAGGALRARIARIEESGPSAEELKKLHARLEDLRAQLSKLPESEKEGRARLEQEIAELKKQIAERHERRIATFPGGGPFPPGTPVPPFGPHAPGQPIPPDAWRGHPGPWFFAAPGGHPEADTLTHKAHALRHAAEQLKDAGLEDQSRELEKQADRLQAEAEKIRAHAPHEPGMIHFGGGAAMELHRSIHELQEQIQQLRKEVAEVRELLQRRQ